MATEIKDIVQSIIDKANETTGGNDETLTDVVQTLCDGYGNGGEPEAAKDVNFIDYDGTIRYSYTAAEFAALTALPANPTHEGLTAQGWNWTLARAKAYVAKYGRLWIGQMYITDDGKTRFYIHLEEGRTSPAFQCYLNGTLDVDWGDGTAHDTLTGSSEEEKVFTQRHLYQNPGDYVISLEITGNVTFSKPLDGNPEDGYYSRTTQVYCAAIRKVELGSGNITLQQNTFGGSEALKYIVIPQNPGICLGSVCLVDCGINTVVVPGGVTTLYDLGDNVKMLAIPDGVVTFGNDGWPFSAKKLTEFTPPEGVTEFKYLLSDNAKVISAVIPDTVTVISGSFSNAESLSNIVIPSSVLEINDSFYFMSGLGVLRFMSEIPPALNNSFSDLPTDCKIHVPHGTLSAYTTAENYPDPSIYTYVEDPE